MRVGSGRQVPKATRFGQGSIEHRALVNQLIEKARGEGAFRVVDVRLRDGEGEMAR